MPTATRFALVAMLIFSAGVTRAADTHAEIVVQTSLTAGLAHHEAKAVWDQLQVGDPLDLVRERGNPHDLNAVRVDWNRRTLGYIPRTDNEAVARQLDRGARLSARIVSLDKYRNHRRKLGVEIYVRM
jgi:hypothetical protein